MYTVIIITGNKPQVKKCFELISEDMRVRLETVFEKLCEMWNGLNWLKSASVNKIIKLCIPWK